MHTFGPLITAMVTPFDEYGKLCIKSAKKLARYLIEQGSDGLVLSGSTGESPVLSRDEKLELFRAVCEEVGNDGAVIGGTGSNNTGESASFTREAEKTGLAGIMLVTPYYNKPPQEGLYRHFKEIAGSTSLPVILYNVPGRTGVNMSAETTLRLARIYNIVAVKEASADIGQILSICQGAPPGFQVYSGDDSMLFPVLKAGGCGVISIASHLVAPRIREIIELFRKGDTNTAEEKFGWLMPLFEGLFMTTNPIPVKEALAMLGLTTGTLRLPLVPLTEEEREQLKKLMDRYDLLPDR